MFTREFWLGDSGALVRAIRTWAQTALATLGLGTVNLFAADWKNVLAVSTSAAILSLLMSLDRWESLLSAPPGKPDPVGSADPSAADYNPACPA